MISPLILSFLLLVGITCGSALFMLWTKQLLHAALAMFMCMLGLAGLYVLAYADVMAVSHLLIYVGGVLILILFGIMMTNQQPPASNQVNDLLTQEQGRFLPLLMGISMFLGLGYLLAKNTWIPSDDMQTQSKIKEVGIALLTDYSFPFELVGIYLLIALIGATFIAKKDA